MASVVLRAFLLLSFMVLCSGLSIKADRKKRSFPLQPEGPCEIIGNAFCSHNGECISTDKHPYYECECDDAYTGDRCQDEAPIPTEPPTMAEVTRKPTTKAPPATPSFCEKYGDIGTCNGNGKCIDVESNGNGPPFECKCYSGYTGMQCGVKLPIA